MTNTTFTTFTYRGGKKVALTKRADQFVTRASPEALRQIGIHDAERVSSSSSRVTTRTADLEATMARCRTMAPTHHAYQLAGSGTEFLITDRVLVSFKDALPPERVAEIAGRYGLKQLQAYSDRDFLFELTNHTGINPVKLVVQMTENDPAVARVDHDLNVQMRRCALTLPTDPAYAREWHLHRHFQHPEVDPRASARVEEAWQLLDHFGSRDVVVGLTDDGCKLDHPDFDSPGKFAGWGYFVQSRLVKHNDADAMPAAMHLAGENHGTSCAGVIAGEADAALTVGAAPGCRLLPIRWELTATRGLAISDSKMMTMLDWIADKVDVLSNSWGGVPINEWAQMVVDRIRQLAQTGGRRQRGIVFLWAAGNENCPIQHDAAIDLPYTWGWERIAGSWTWVGVERTRTFRNNLVSVPGVMHVAALASGARRSHYSNHGTGIAVCAPTNNVHFYQRLDLPGLGVTTTTGDGSGVTDDFGGTSSATPLTAGIAALVISANPGLGALQVVSTLHRTAAKDLDTTPWPRTPPASYDPNPTWDVSPAGPFANGDFLDIQHPDGTWSPWFGHGRVSAVDAVAAARAALAPGGGGEGNGSGTAGTAHYASAPARAVPDNNAAGVHDTIDVPDTGALVSIAVRVDITHTFIGDLVVTLQAPSGKRVVLHARSGGNTHDLRRTFDATTTPALRTLVNEPVRGAWTLLVQDLAAIDTGVLARWELDLAAVADGTVELGEAPGTSIPDNDAVGIERTLTATGPGNIAALEVHVDITHTYIGDLEVTLVSPTGHQAPLHVRTGGGTDNLIGTWSSATLPALQAMAGQPLAGAWRLRVADRDRIDLGKLNRWSVRITKQPAVVLPASPVRPQPAASAPARSTGRKPSRSRR